MNLITVTYNADTHQLVPKKVSDKWLEKTGLLICAEDEEFINAVLAAAPQPETLSPWLPIETAPKDGTEVLLYGVSCINGLGVFKSNYVLSVLGHHHWDGVINATHWMPLPAPPKPEQPK